MMPEWPLLCSQKYVIGPILNQINSFKICKFVHHRTIQINHQPDATVFQFIILTFIYSSTCFGVSRPSSGAQWLQWQPLVLPSYRGDSRAVFVVEPAGSYIVFNFDIFRPEWRVRLSFSSMRPANPSHFILAVSAWLCTDYEDQLDVVFYPFSRYVFHWD
jgi:hypothetical protein